MESLLSIGADPDQTEAIRGGRSVFNIAFIIATIFSVPQAASDFADEYTWVAVMDVVVSTVVFGMVFAIWRRPSWFVAIVTSWCRVERAPEDLFIGRGTHGRS